MPDEGLDELPEVNLDGPEGQLLEQRTADQRKALQWGTEEHMKQAWYIYKMEKNGGWGWDTWRASYLRMFENNQKGAGFERFMVDKFGLDGWRTNVKLPSDVLPSSPRIDITNVQSSQEPAPDQRVMIELKSGNTLNSRDRRQFEKYANLPNGSVVALFGSQPDAATVAWLENLFANKAASLCVRYVPAVPSNDDGSSTDGSLTPMPVSPDSALGQSADTAADAAEEMKAEDAVESMTGEESTPVAQQVPTSTPTPQPQAPVTDQSQSSPQTPATAPESPTAPAPATQQVPATGPAPVDAPVPVTVSTPSTSPPPVAVPLSAPASPVPLPNNSISPGGVDFTSLELRFVTDSVEGQAGMQYAFSADEIAEDLISYGGRRNADMAMDAFYVWMALPQDSFWVNLNPTEPDRIVDDVFGQTEAGQVLLEADLEMKEVSGRLMNTDTELGKRFVDGLEGEDKCFLGRRQWIEPLPAVVHEDGDQLYILEAPLTVNLGLEDSDISPGSTCEGQDPAITERNGQLYLDLIMPAVVEAINNNVEFSDLRRVYASRVAAEWYRERNADKATMYSSVINSGDISQWTKEWSPREVFDRYTDSFYNGHPVFEWTEEVPDGTVTHTMSWGGVVFEDVVLEEVGEERFTAEFADVTQADRSMTGVQQINNQYWFGGVVSPVPATELWPYVPSPILAPVPAPTSPHFYLLVAAPIATWSAISGFIIWRRRRVGGN